MTEDTSLKDEVKKLNENFSKLIPEEKKKKEKKFKVPKLGKSQLKKNYVNYLFVRENRDIKPMKLPIDDGVVVVEDVPRVATTEYMFTMNGQPTVIQPEWALFPIDPNKNRTEAERQNMTAKGMKTLLAKIESGQIKAKKKLSGAMIFGIIIAVLVIGYFIVKRFGG